jgi:signal transduction histidine kinase
MTDSLRSSRGWRQSEASGGAADRNWRVIRGTSPEPSHDARPAELAQPSRDAGVEDASPADLLLNLTGQAAFRCSPIGLTLFINDALERLLTNSLDTPGDFPGWTPDWLTCRAMVSSLMNTTPWALMRDTVGPVETPVWVARLDGERIAATLRGQAVRDARGSVVEYQGFLIEDTPASEDLARQVARLRARLRRRVANIRTERADERAALSRRLHDQLGQTLVVLKLELERLAARAVDGGALAHERRALNAMRTWAEQSLKMVRTLCLDLRADPPARADVSAEVVELTRDFGRRWDLRVAVNQTGEPLHVDGHSAQLIVEVCREALTNIVRHAHATEVSLHVARQRRRTVIALRDNGRGFAPSALVRRDAFGVMGMRERAKALGGDLDISREGTHTVVTLTLPTVANAAADPDARTND